MTYKCECLVAGYCERHKITKTGRDVEICQGVRISPQQRASYQKYWDARSGVQIQPAKQVGQNTATQSHKKTVAVPRDKWPWYMTLISQLATEEDVGVGDTIHRNLGSVGAVYETAFKMLGKTCGCSNRRTLFNRKYPYRTKEV